MSEEALYPPLEPFSTKRMQVSDLHMLYIEQSGNPTGKPALFLHGGPGAGLSPKYRQFFDPDFYRLILFDQRGSGKSTPHAELRENTTWDLVSDIEKIRTDLGIDSWLVFGGSWGSTLALAYAIRYPERVKGLILRGVFLGRKQEIDWMYINGAGRIQPEEYEQFTSIIPVEERGNILQAYYKRLIDESLDIRMQAGRAWMRWEFSIATLLRDNNLEDDLKDELLVLALSRIEAHYMIHNCFFESDDYLLEQIEKTACYPCKIVQGRYDLICPIQSAWDLMHHMRDVELQVIPNAGHSAFEDGTAKALVTATEDYKQLFI